MRDLGVSACIRLGIVSVAFGTLGVSAAVFGDIRVALGWGVAAAALFVVIAIVGAVLSPTRSPARAAFLLFGCASVLAAELGDISSWLADFVTVMNGSTVTYVWHGETFAPTATEILFGSASVLGFVGAAAFFFLGGLLALAGAVQRTPRTAASAV